MQKQLKMLHTILQKVDESADISNNFYECKMGKSKYSIIKDALHQVEHDCSALDDCVEVRRNTEKLLDNLNARYHMNQHRYCWQSHMCHFHMSLEQWINCPMTCITEVNEFIEKILKGD